MPEADGSKEGAGGAAGIQSLLAVVTEVSKIKQSWQTLTIEDMKIRNSRKITNL